MERKKNIKQYSHQVELSDYRGLLLDAVELAVPEEDVDGLLRGATHLDGGGGLFEVARAVSPHTWLVRLAEGFGDGHQFALK